MVVFGALAVQRGNGWVDPQGLYSEQKRLVLVFDDDSKNVPSCFMDNKSRLMYQCILGVYKVINYVVYSAVS